MARLNEVSFTWWVLYTSCVLRSLNINVSMNCKLLLQFEVHFRLSLPISLICQNLSLSGLEILLLVMPSKVNYIIIEPEALRHFGV